MQLLDEAGHRPSAKLNLGYPAGARCDSLLRAVVDRTKENEPQAISFAKNTRSLTWSSHYGVPSNVGRLC